MGILKERGENGVQMKRYCICFDWVFFHRGDFEDLNSPSTRIGLIMHYLFKACTVTTVFFFLSFQQVYAACTWLCGAMSAYC